MRSISLAVVATAVVAMTSAVSAFVAPASPVRTTRTTAASMTVMMSIEPASTAAAAASPPSPSSVSWRRRAAGFGCRMLERSDTLRAAGLLDGDKVPVYAGFKSNVGLLVGAFLFKWYRARFITKIPVWDRQPQWNMVVTSPEQEVSLKAMECKTCGSTLFIARHREWFFQGGNTKCTNCGATGKDNFRNVRDDVIDNMDDDYFDYESPLDFVSAAERRKLVKEAGGDEEKAKQLAIERAMENDKDMVQAEEEVEDQEGEAEAEAEAEEKVVEKKKVKKAKKAPSVSPVEAKQVEVDDDDEFDLDAL